MAADDILIRIEGNEAEFRASMRSAENILRDSTRKMQTSLNGIDKSFMSVNKTMGMLKTGVAGLVAGIGLKQVATQFYDVNKSFQDLFAGLKTATGSTDAANAEFDKLRAFAAETPYDLQQVITAFIKLKNLGLDPSIESLRAYGDVAAAMPGKSLDQFIEAVADAATGEFERLKEFGIKSSSEGDRVKFTFRGMTTEVKKSADSIERYLQDLAKTNFGGAMAEKMNTIGGAASNLGDAMDNLFVTIGKSGVVENLVAALQKLAALVNQMAGNTQATFTWGDDLARAREEAAALRTELENMPPLSIFAGGAGSDARLKKERLAALEAADAYLQLQRVQEKIASLQSSASTSGPAAASTASAIAKLREQEDALKAAIEARKAAETGGKAAPKAETPATDPAEAKKIAGVLEDLRLAYDNLGRSAREAYIATQLDKAGIDGNSEKGQAIRDLAGAYYDARDAAEAVAKEEAALDAERDRRKEQEDQGRKDVDKYIADLRRQNEILKENVDIQAGLTAVAEQEQKAREAGIELTEKQKESIRGLADENEKLKERQDSLKALSNDLGSAVGTAFEDAIISGGKFSDVLKGLEQDILRIILRMTVTKGLEKAIGGAVGGIATAFGFADGGVMSSQGPLPLRKYASGGIANSPQMAVFGEGRMNEAFVPLPDGRSIPVTMQGGAGDNYVFHQVANVSGDGVTPADVRKAMDITRGQVINDIRNIQKRTGSSRI